MAVRPDAAALRRAGLWILAAEIALVPVVFDAAAMVPFEVAKAAAAWALTLVLATVLVLIAFAERGVRRPGPLLIAVAAYGVIAFVATAQSADPNTAVFGALDRMLGLLTIFHHLVLCAAIVVIPRTRRDAEILAGALLVPSVLVITYVGLQRSGLDFVRWASSDFERSFSTFGNATMLGQYLLAIGVTSLALSAVLEPRYGRLRIALAVWGAVLIVAIVTTGTRAVLGGLVLAALPLALLAWRRDRSPAARRALMLSGGATLALFLALIFLTPFGARLGSAVSSLNEAAAPTAATRDLSLAGRFVFYEVALAEVRERPLFGWGPDGFVLRFPALRPERSAITLGNTTPETSPHSWVAQVATGTGLVGLAAFSAVVLLALISALRSREPLAHVAACALIAWLGGGLISVNSIGTDWLPWFAIGTIAACTRPPSPALPETDRQARRGRKRGRAARVASGDPRLTYAAIAVAAVIAYLLVAPIVSGSRSAEEARRARQRGDVARAVAASRAAVEADPRRAEYWHGLGLGEAAAGRFAEAIPSFERAIQLAPYHATYRGNLARAHLELGLRNVPGAADRALAGARGAVEVDPNNAAAHFSVAVVLERLGRHVEAGPEVDRAFALDADPAGSEPYHTAARVYVALRRDEDAARVAELGVRESERREEPFARDLRFLLVDTLVRLGRLEAALVEVTHIISHQPADTRALRLRDEIVAMSGTR